MGQQGKLRRRRCSVGMRTPSGGIRVDRGGEGVKAKATHLV